MRNEPIIDPNIELPADYRFSSAYLAFCLRAVEAYIPIIEQEYKQVESNDVAKLLQHLAYMGACTKQMLESSIRNGIRT